jgi:hypothetical protein
MRTPQALPSPNRFVRAVSSANRKSFLADCDTLELQLSDHVAEPGRPHPYVYFPGTALLSQIAAGTDSAGVEVTLAGDEGMVGATLTLGVSLAPLLVVVQGSGATLRMTAKDFLRHVADNPRLDSLVKRYLYVQIVQLARASVCTRYHLVEQRLARWLLMMHDRAHADDFHLTHEFLAAMLGVRRVGVTQAATALQRRGLITYHRGAIVIRDRQALVAAACPCYAADNLDYADVMGG